MKSPVVLFVVSLLTLVYVVFRIVSVRPRAIPTSDVALIQFAVHRCWGCGVDGPTYAIDTAFRNFGPTRVRAHAERKRLVHGALTRNPRAAFIAQVAVTPLVTPNASPDVLALQRQLARANGDTTPVFSLTFSVPATLADGTRCYYVEKRRWDHRWGSGDIYVLRKGAVVSVVDVWVN
ncbi:hypothetical protein GCM10027345_16950 [Hymenobacter daeguensis]